MEEAESLIRLGLVSRAVSHGNHIEHTVIAVTNLGLPGCLSHLYQELTYLLGVLLEISFLDIREYDLRGLPQNVPVFVLPYSFKTRHGGIATEEFGKERHRAIHPALMLY